VERLPVEHRRAPLPDGRFRADAAVVTYGRTAPGDDGPAAAGCQHPDVRSRRRADKHDGRGYWRGYGRRHPRCRAERLTDRSGHRLYLDPTTFSVGDTAMRTWLVGPLAGCALTV
jgi:hypothetical protein